MSTREIVRRSDIQHWDFRSESSFMEVRIGNPLCIFHCRPREADWLNSMHESRTKEWPYALQREDRPRVRDIISTACNNFSVIAEERVGRTAMYGELSCARGITSHVVIHWRSSSSSSRPLWPSSIYATPKQRSQLTQSYLTQFFLLSHPWIKMWTLKLK